MPTVNLRASPRARNAIAGVLAAALAAGGGYALMPGSGVRAPDDVVLAATYLNKPWEGEELRAYPDPATGGAPWTICNGDTFGVRPGMVETPDGCDKRLVRRMAEFRTKYVACMPGFERMPLSVRAMFNSLGYNIGPAAACNSTAADLAVAGRYLDACKAATRFNKAAGRVFVGLVKRREMGDAQRIGEGELCVAGL